MINKEQIYKMFENSEKLKEFENLLVQYENILNAKQNKIDIKTYISIIEKYFGGKISCGNCSASIKKAQSDYERVVFTNLYRNFPQMLYKPDKNVLIGTRFVNGMFETLVTSSFSLFSEFLQSFENDFVGKRLNIDRVLYDNVCNELIKFNTNRYRYFELLDKDGNDSPYSIYLDFKNPKPVEIENKIVKNLTINENATSNLEKYKSLKKIDLVQALELKNNGKSNQEIADIFGVTKQAVGKLFKTNLQNEKE